MAFMRHALLASTCIAVAGSAVGYFAVLRQQAFAAHALSNVGFAGAAGAILAGVNPMVGLFVFTMAAAVVLSAVSPTWKENDVGVGMVLMFSLGLGALFLNVYGANADAAIGILFGSVFGISSAQVKVIVVVSLCVLVVLAALFRPLRYASINEQAARASGVPVALVGLLFILTLAATAAVAVPVIGALLSFAIFVGPAAAAQAWTGRVATGLFLTVAFALVQTWCGLLASYYWNYPATSWIAGFSFAFYLFSLLAKRYGARRWADDPLPAIPEG
jgi:zinc/manganese transport system permease protein